MLAVCGLTRHLVVVFLLGMVASADADDQLTQGLQAPPGFEVRQFAGDELASDIYSLTIDSAGRVVVAGRGYVRILRDEDGDGIAESARQFADGPDNGAMGMCWDGPDLIRTGDAGLLRYRDVNGDERADGSPEVLLEAKTGGEHDLHAIRKGPDGWWYLLGGNNAGLDQRYVTLPTSPVTSPSAGALVRITPDFTGSEVIADGFRNPYDFAFNAAGRLFAFDSDGERDVSLPWYRPTRVFEILSGAHAGWFSRSWKRPGYFLDMPPVVAAFGRGSPTGVECYRHTQFPAEYRGGLFVLDWTYGRVMFVPPVDADGKPIQEPEEFLTGVGSFGFAPTDAAVAPDGSLFVSIGGRGTRGGVYRIRWTDGHGEWPAGSALDQCLRAPQPLSSWSRARWEPLLSDLNAEMFQSVALDVQRPVVERVRAIEILCERFGGADATTTKRLFHSSAPAVRSTAAWSWGRHPAVKNISDLARLLADDDVTVRRSTAEALLGTLPGVAGTGRAAFDPRSLVPALSSRHRPTIHAIARVLSRLSDDNFALLSNTAPPDDIHAQLTLASGGILRGWEVRRSVLEGLLSPRFDKAWADRPVDAIRLVQLALGDVGPGDHAPVFDGYAASSNISSGQFDTQTLEDFASRMFPSGNAILDHELGRVFAMLQTGNPEALKNVLDQVTETSPPVEDVHYLIVAARLPAPRTEEQTLQVARGLLAIDGKIRQRGLNTDSNWDDRVGEMYAALIKHDSGLPAALIQQEEFGRPGHVTFVENLPDNLRPAAVDAFVEAIRTDPKYRWNDEIVRLLSTSDRDDVRELLKRQAGEFAVRSSVLTALARRPQQDERNLFVDGLESADLEVLRRMVSALRRLGPDSSTAEQVALVRTLRRVGEGDGERNLKESILRRLEQNTGVVLRAPQKTHDARQTVRELTELWTNRIREHSADEWAAQTGSSLADADQLQEMLDEVDWTSGSRSRGETLFHQRSCAQCHGGRRALGPDLHGAAGRFSREDLFTAIALPDRDVSPRYQSTLIVTNDGQTHTGLVIYESIDGLLMRNSRGETVRIEADEIDVRRRLTTSLMPGGLLKDLQPGDLADLYAYLKSLR